MNHYYKAEQARSDEYTIEQITSIIKHYDELYSVVQVTAVSYDKVRAVSTNHTKEDILCSLIDVEQSIAILSPLQQKIFNKLKAGHTYSEISFDLQLSTSSLRYNLKQALAAITDYLNSNKAV
ncbi:hypothetical protein SRRS_45150 [Sporomusa rhizae]|uniref:hypothetical protein n=1 Tax=Sporomusa rhizae TaxID=357999 RepID=UPI00352ABBF1